LGNDGEYWDEGDDDEEDATFASDAEFELETKADVV
jgi:hypothetical protein